MFVRGVSHKTYWLEGAETGCSALRLLAEKEAVPTEVLLQQNGKFVEDWDQRLMPVTLHVIQKGGLLGGKGGFGSMLRSIGAQIERTTNHEAMRDLSGRRQRDVNRETRLKEYIAGTAEREKEAEEKKEKKLEHLRRVATGENVGKHEFSDPDYDKVRSETEEKVHDSVEAAMVAIATNSKVEKEKELKRKADTAGPVPKKKGMWMGSGLDDLDDLDDSDLSDSDDEKEKAVAKVSS